MEIGRLEPQLGCIYGDPRNHLHTGERCLVAELIVLGKLVTKPQEPNPPSTRVHHCGSWVSDLHHHSGEAGTFAAITTLQTNRGFLGNQWGAEKGMNSEFWPWLLLHSFCQHPPNSLLETAAGLDLYMQYLLPQSAPTGARVSQGHIHSLSFTGLQEEASSLFVVNW